MKELIITRDGFKQGLPISDPQPKPEEITLGDIRIVKLEESPDKILLQYVPGGMLAEGGQFNKEKFEKHIEKFFHENF